VSSTVTQNTTSFKMRSYSVDARTDAASVNNLTRLPLSKPRAYAEQPCIYVFLFNSSTHRPYHWQCNHTRALVQECWTDDNQAWRSVEKREIDPLPLTSRDLHGIKAVAIPLMLAEKSTGSVIGIIWASHRSMRTLYKKRVPYVRTF